MQRYQSGEERRSAARWWPVGLLAAAAIWWWRARPFRVMVEGFSMAPTLEPGEFLVATRPPRHLQRGALVVVAPSGHAGLEMVKRLYFMSGDRMGERVLGPDEFWVQGDAPMASTDSRAFGPVRRKEIRGVVRARYWPLARIASLRSAAPRRAGRGA